MIAVVALCAFVALAASAAPVEKERLVMFYTNTRSSWTVQQIYNKIYKPKFAPDAWFKLDGKPVIVGPKTGDWMSILVDGVRVNGRGRETVNGRRFTLVVPRVTLGCAKGPFTLNFKFVDSTIPCRDPLDWYDHGVVAPPPRPAAFRLQG